MKTRGRPEKPENEKIFSKPVGLKQVDWDFLDSTEDKNRSEFLREIIQHYKQTKGLKNEKKN